MRTPACILLGALSGLAGCDRGETPVPAPTAAEKLPANPAVPGEQETTPGGIAGETAATPPGTQPEKAPEKPGE
jgi:hypothetical protein